MCISRRTVKGQTFNSRDTTAAGFAPFSPRRGGKVKVDTARDESPRRGSGCGHISGPRAVSSALHTSISTCLDVVKEAKVLEREALSVTGKSFVTTSKVSRSPPSVDWLAEVESKESQVSSMKKLEVSSRSS